MTSAKISSLIGRIDRWQVIGDCLMLLAFILIGEQDHGFLDDPDILWVIVRAFLLFGVPWIVAAVWCGAFVPVRRGNLLRWLLAALQASLVALPLGIWLRALWLGRAVVPTIFITATLAFGILFLLGWRLLYGIWRARSTANTVSGAP